MGHSSIPYDCGQVYWADQAVAEYSFNGDYVVKVITAKLRANNVNSRLNLVTVNLMPVSTRRIMYG
jgi:hypothetical protein